MTSDTYATRLRRPVATALTGAATLLAASVAVLWAWNTLAVGLFSAPPAQFRHAVAFALVPMIVAWLWRTGTRWGGSSRAAS